MKNMSGEITSAETVNRALAVPFFDDVEASVIQLMAENDQTKTIKPDDELSADLGLSSFSQLTLMFMAQEKYGIDITQYSDEIAKIITVRDVCLFLKEVAGSDCT